MRQDPRNPGKPVGKSAKSGFTPGASKRGKAAYRVTGDPGDALGGPQPVPAPQARPRPAPRPHATASNHAPLPAPTHRATGGRVPPGHTADTDGDPNRPAYGGGAMPAAYAGPSFPGQQYQPPGVNAHLLGLLARALSPDTF